MKCCMTLRLIRKLLSQMKEIGINEENVTHGSRRFIRGYFTSVRPLSMSVILLALEGFCRRRTKEVSGTPKVSSLASRFSRETLLFEGLEASLFPRLPLFTRGTSVSFYKPRKVAKELSKLLIPKHIETMHSNPKHQNSKVVTALLRIRTPARSRINLTNCLGSGNG